MTETTQSQAQKSTPNLQQNLRDSQQWMRLAYMLVFAVMLNVAALVMWVLCALQFILTLATGSSNDNLRRLARSIIEFIRQALAYVSYNSDEKPFPFADWPAADTQGDKKSESVADPLLERSE